MSLVAGLIPPPSDGEIRDGLQAALTECRQVGITSVQDMDGSGAATRKTYFGLLQNLARAAKLTLRVRVYWPLSAWNSLAQLGILAGFGDLWVSLGALKDFIDGSLGSSTAKMFDPYLNEPGSTGIYVTPPGKLRDNILAADKAGLGIAIHAIGDRGNAELLDIFAEVIQKNGPRERRFRIEHAQHLRPQDYQRFAELGVIASMQPYHVIDDGRWAEGRIGAKRCASSYALHALLNAGAKVAFGSDSPVAPLNPLLGIDAAVHRRTLDGKHPKGWFPEQRITVAEAIECYTLTSAYAAFLEKDLGSLAVGKLADLVVLSRDILAEGERENIASTAVVMTMVDGRVVFQRDK
jgi:predicted amidohydrolase YtcJ